ncbi:Pml1p [Kluyveromyces lactis]|uniref:KLLA0D09526p n=1 Tax=Kluyveromyces lactis (strain ATCC 8585 / CBS 2359 / DSM 70799 / NBRC 1267 / NRRL Y-1140 / WM37) TaxID=284590 RepID=Q6CRF3_KLULA|nr:uncharacterized protein KLLA0_D09526g [Kluyveromyces lactis]CAH00582.1 KLLA0D09526p [Kluyveromyces lactis]|eukprot:XP_453486.1 uncharacterized protein KLLA0_D09526g [Kluyveromyces lactis]
MEYTVIYGSNGAKRMSIKREGSRYRYDHETKRSRYEGAQKKVILPIFEPSGLLELESHQKKGIQLKHVEPKDAISPHDFYKKLKVPKWDQIRYELVVYRKGVKGEVSKTKLHDKSCYIIGRGLGQSLRRFESDGEEIILADIPIQEESCSKEHCAVQFRQVGESLIPYLIDLDSSNGTCLNDSAVPSARYIELKSSDIIHVSEDPNDSDYELIFLAV